MSSLHRNAAADFAHFWPRLGIKMAVALVACVTIRALFAQTAAPSAPTEVDARGYKYLVASPTLTTDKNKRKQIEEYVKGVNNGTSALGDRRGEYEAYYTRYFFPLMTHTTEANLKRLADDRQAFLRLLENSKSPEAHTALVAITLREMTSIVQHPELHPAVRYNAMLIISNLNDTEPVRQLSNPTFPVPAVRARNIIWDEFKKPENPDYIKIAALLGLSRHLEWDNEKPQQAQIPANDRTPIIKELIALAQANEAPPNRYPETHLWMRRRAVEALGFASLRKADPEIADAMIALLKDEAQPVPLRCTVAATLGKMSVPVGKIDAQAIAKELGYLALLACDEELTRVTKLSKDELDHAIRLTGQIPSEMGSSGPASPRAGLVTAGMNTGSDAAMSSGYASPRGTAYAGPSSDGGSAYGGMGGYGGAGGYGYDPSMPDPKLYRLDLSRRQLSHFIFCFQLVFTGVYVLIIV
jgi:hypothetical protein